MKAGRFSIMCALVGLIVVGMILGLGSGQSYAQIPGVVGVWLLDEGTGNKAMDISGNNNNGDILGNPKWVTGRYGKALELDGKDDWVKVAQSPSILTTAKVLSLALWIYPTDAENQGNVVEINGNSGWRLRYLKGAGLKIYDRANTNSIVKNGVAPLNTWTHVAVTGDGTGLRLYANGKKIGETNKAFAPNLAKDHLSIGTCEEFNEYFKGLVDEVIVLNKVLSEAEVTVAMLGVSNLIPSMIDPQSKLAVSWGGVKLQ